MGIPDQLGQVRVTYFINSYIFPNNFENDVMKIATIE